MRAHAGRASWLLGALVAGAILPCASAADSPAATDSRADPFHDRIYLFGGFDLARDTAFVWTGLVGAPYGQLADDGLRLRAMVGYGGYRYRSGAVAGGRNDGTATSGELMLGWRGDFEPVQMNFYLGAHAENHRLRKRDPGNPVQGTEVGIKATVETFARVNPDWIATGSASASSVHRKYHVRAAIAREFDSGNSLGFETAYLGDARYREPRAGLLLSHSTIARNVFMLTGGYLHNSDRGSGAYITLSIYSPY